MAVSRRRRALAMRERRPFLRTESPNVGSFLGVNTEFQLLSVLDCAHAGGLRIAPSRVPTNSSSSRANRRRRGRVAVGGFELPLATPPRRDGGACRRRSVRLRQLSGLIASSMGLQYGLGNPFSNACRVRRLPSRRNRTARAPRARRPGVVHVRVVLDPNGVATSARICSHACTTLTACPPNPELRRVRSICISRAREGWAADLNVRSFHASTTKDAS